MVRQVATQARADFEEDKIPRDLLTHLHGEYCTNIDPGLFVHEALAIFPTGNCGLASVYIRHQLQFGEVTHGSYAGEGHTFWHLGKAMLADITADQFDGPQVYVGPLIEPWSLEAPAQLS